MNLWRVVWGSIPVNLILKKVYYCVVCVYIYVCVYALLSLGRARVTRIPQKTKTGREMRNMRGFGGAAGI
jgi:hypothetical protein